MTPAKKSRKRRPSPPATDFWAEASGGVRGSSLLRLGALLMCLAALLNGAGTALQPSQSLLGIRILKVAWLLWIGDLWLVGAGFIWIGLNPVLSRIGLATGLLHLFQGLFLLLTLFANLRLPVTNTALSTGRLLAIVLFAIVERRTLPGRQVAVLILAAGLLQAKLVLRTLTVLREMPEVWLMSLDVLLLLGLGLALLGVAASVRREETWWAEEQYQARATGFSAFNNPQHPWNRD